jgi:hypothetical protein
MAFSSDSFIIENPYNVIFIPACSAGGLGRQLHARRARAHVETVTNDNLGDRVFRKKV